MSLQRNTIRYSELYYARKLAVSWLEDIQDVLSKHDKWYKPKLDKEKRKELEAHEQKLFGILDKIDKHFLENSDLINFQCDPDYIMP